MLPQAIEKKSRLPSLSRVTGARIGLERRTYPDGPTSCGSILTHLAVLGRSSLPVHTSLKRKPPPACRGYPAPRQRRSQMSLPDSGRMASRSFMLSVTHRPIRRMTKGPLGERPAWVRGVRKCEPSRPACAIQRRPMSPIETWKSAASNG